MVKHARSTAPLKRPPTTRHSPETHVQIETPAKDGKPTPSDEPNSFILTDPAVFDCEICMEMVSPPVYQCKNGHMACASCCTKMENICSYCKKQIGHIRCRPIENILQSVLTCCSNKGHGCSEMMFCPEKAAHEKACKFAPCLCPEVDCNYIGPRDAVYDHFWNRHSEESLQVHFANPVKLIFENDNIYAFLLHETDERVVFVVTRSLRPRGNLVNVVCIAPPAMRNKFSYWLAALKGENSVKLEMNMECIQEWTGDLPEAACLLVPNDFLVGGRLILGLIIRRK